MKFRSKLAAPLLATVCITMVLTSCGSSKHTTTSTTVGSGGTASTASPGTTVAAATGTPIPIGYIEDQTGGTSGTATSGTGTAEAWVKWTNAKGGIGGHPIKLYTANTASDPAQATSEVENFINNDHIIALWQNATSTEPSWNPILFKAGIPVIGGSCYFPEWTLQPNMYCTSTMIEAGLYASEFVVKHAGFTKQALNQCNNVAACTSALPLAIAGAKSLGINLLTTKSSATAPSFTPQCLADKNFGAQAVELGGLAVGPFVQSCTAQNYKPVYVNEYDLFKLSDISANPGLEGAIGDDQTFPTFPAAAQFPQWKDYFTAMQQYEPQLMQGGSLYEQNYGITSGTSWSGALVTGEGLTNAAVPASQTVTVADLERGLAMIPQGSTNGLYTPPVYYGNGTTTVEKATTCFWLSIIKNGQYQLQGDPTSVTSQCEPVSLLFSKGGQTVAAK